jgi:putative phage-type endonuclease
MNPDLGLTIEQRDARSKGLGGSDIGPMLGLSKYKTPMDLWAEKTGHKKPEDLSDVEFIYFGNVLEDIVAQEFARRTHRKVRRMNKMQVHREHKWMLANIDRDVVGENAGLECKTSSAWLQQEWGETGTDDVPLYYLTQCVHYMEVMEYDRYYLAVLIGGQEFRWYVIERNPTLAEQLVEQETIFWQRVLEKRPPPPVNYQDLCTLYPKDKGGVTVATDEVYAMLARLAEIKADAEKLDEERELMRMGVSSFMAEASRLLGTDGRTLATWKAHQQNRVDVSAMQKADGTLAQVIEAMTPRLKREPTIADLAASYRKPIDVRPLRITDAKE